MPAVSSDFAFGPETDSCSAAFATIHGAAREVKLGGFNEPTQDVSGACGSARNETITAWAQGDAGATTCPTPGMLMIVALDRFAAAAFAPAREVNVSKLPEMSSVGMLLATGRRMAVGAAGTFQTLVEGMET